MEGKGLGFRPGPDDDRDHSLRVALERLGIQKTSGSQFWYSPMPRLDQGNTPQCVGYSRINSINASPKIQHYGPDVAQEIYKSAQHDFDEWPGEDYDGTSVRAGAKAAQAKGLIKSYAFTYSIQEMALWVLNRGCLVIGIDWYSDMFHPTKRDGYFIKPTGAIEGGHAICVDGASYFGNDNDWFRLLNSWGQWGYNGRCKILASDMAKLFESDNAVSCTAVEF